MTEQELRRTAVIIPPTGRAVLCAWAAVPGLFAAPFVFWQSAAAGGAPQRLDGAAPISSHIAPQKARTAALGCRESRVYEELINNGRTSFLSAPQLEGMLEGGVNIVVDGRTIGAIGVSGVKSAEDAQIAKAGIAALGL